MAATNPNDTVYKTRTLSKWFAIGSIILLLSVVWAVVQDYDRDWKRYGRQYHKLVAAIGERKLAEANAALDKSKLEGIKKQIKELEKKQGELTSELDKKIDRRSDIYYKANQVFQNTKAQLDADLFILETALAERKPNAAHLKLQWEHLEKKVLALKDEATTAEKNRDTAIAEKADFISKQRELNDQLAALQRDQGRLEKVIAKNEVNLGNIVRNAPVVDFISPTVKITQIILPRLKDDYFFNKVPRVDRCMTCHANADQPGFEDYPQPFKSHPKLNLMLGAASPHPVEKIGCTVCHAGIPQSVDFSLAGHVPKDEAQLEEWKDKYGFNPPPHLPTPMLPTAMTEGKCIQCHAKQVVLQDAPTFNAGMRLIERYGCYTCHKFAGHFEQLAKEKKPGPILKMISSKLNEDWVKKFIWDPKSYRPTSLMPRFWKNHNNSDPASLARGAVEVDAIAHFLFKKAVPFQPLKIDAKIVGNLDHGKKLVGSVGCLACHAVDDFPRNNPTDPTALGYKDPRVPMFGPELNQMGSKVNKEWLQSWLIDPKHYWENSGMPSLKLSPQEAADISSYLLSKTNDKFDSTLPPEPTDKTRDEVVLTYFNAIMTQDQAKTKLASMSLEDKRLYLGEKLIGHYGCYGCHAIEGFENTPNVGAELTYEGSKDVSKFAFENVHARHDRAGWIYTKVRTPRIWDVGKNRDFEAKTRMPYFGFTHDQATAIAAIVLGYENKNVDDEAVFKVDGRMEQVIAGERQINRNNCIGCHAIEKRGGEVLAHYPDDVTLGPPNLNTEGLKLQTDWMYAFLLNPNVPIRPWVEIRMPQFWMSEHEAMSYTKYFAAYDRATYPYTLNAFTPLSAEDTKSAEAIITKQGCLTCHGVRKPGEDVSAAAPHFANIKGRLRGPWILDWLQNPAAIMPGTRMPALWPSTDEDNPKAPHVAVAGYFGDDADKQIEAVRNYLFTYGGAPNLPTVRLSREATDQRTLSSTASTTPVARAAPPKKKAPAPKAR